MAKDSVILLKQGGIYKIYFTDNPNDIYIGSAIDFSKRKIRHKHQLKKQIHKNLHLQRLYNKHGLNNMMFEIIEVVNNMNMLINREQFYINELKPKINILKIAGSALGYRHTKESKKRISLMNTGRKMTSEQIEKGVLSRVGQRTSKGCKRTVKFKKFISEIKKKQVVDVNNGKIFFSIGDAAAAVGLKYSALYAKLSGRNLNKTNLKFL